MDVRTELLRRLETMPLQSQEHLLANLDALSKTQPEGEPGSALAAFAGTLDPASAAEMRAAIDEEFEKVDLREW